MVALTVDARVGRMVDAMAEPMVVSWGIAKVFYTVDVLVGSMALERDMQSDR